MDEHLLNCVFRFKYKPPSNDQEAATCSALATHFAAFVAALQPTAACELPCKRVEPLADDRVVAASAFAAHEVQMLQQVGQCLVRASSRGDARCGRGEVWYDPWLPKYGCALQRTQLNATTVRIEVVFVDGWEQTLHFVPSGACIYSAVATTHHVVHCADLDMDVAAKFSTAFGSELQTAQMSKGSGRSAASNELGHQKTPQFIAAVARRAVMQLTKQTDGVGPTPRGGTTDVGLHTGGRARDTCWAIVQAAIKRNLCCGPGLFRKVMIAMKLKLLHAAVTDAKTSFSCISVKDGCAVVDDLFHMLQVIVVSTAELVKVGYKVSLLEKQCAGLRCSIDEFVDDLNCRTATKYALPGCKQLQKLNKLRCVMKMTSPQRSNDGESGESSDERHRRAWGNLQGCYLLQGSSCSLDELLQWDKANSAPASYKCILTLRTFEAYMFEKALGLNEEGPANSQTDDDSFGLEQMQTLVNRYHQVVSSWRQLRRMTSILDVEQRSREMLVMWTAFCLVHRRCVGEFPLCAQYNIALDWKDLQVAVLNDRAAISALQCVARYIRSWNAATMGSPLFHLSKQAPTFEFGMIFGLNSTSMLTAYDREVAAWEAYEAEQWAKVEKKKRDAASYRQQIADLNQRLASKQASLAAERARRFYYNSDRERRSINCLISSLESEINQISSTIRQTEDWLRTTLVVPPYLVRPLPPSRNDAIQVIFMLTMPRHLEILGNVCMTAQRSLAPANATSDMTRLPQQSPTTWQQFYYQRTQKRAVTATTRVFTASPCPYTLPSTWGPASVDNLYNLSQYKSVCVWNPTLGGTIISWKDAFGVNVDPFAATASSVIDSFVEKMPQSFNHLQWMNAWPDTGGIRGNVVYTEFNRQPSDFDKMSFIALGSLRAFPNQQYRKLQWALLDDVLPWSNCSVGIIVRQSLYQVGALTDELLPQLLWKSDMLDEKNGLSTFCATLMNIASKLKQTPRKFESVPLLSELAGFAMQYTDDASGIVTIFAGMARCWAENARAECREESSPCRIAEVRRKECVMYGIALLAYSLGPWDNRAAEQVCETIVQFRTSYLCASIDLDCTEQMLRFENMIAEVMSRRIVEVVAFVKTHSTDHVLTGLVRLVSATAPGRLKWKEFRELPQAGGQFGSCFEAIDKVTNVHYSVNLFTGTVLTDGHAPGGLPSAIREHKSFRSLFGHRNFKVLTSNGVFRSERKYYDRLYDFALEGEELFVQELVSDTAGSIIMTLQLCSDEWVKALTDQFPARLQSLYSHWYWVEKNCVLFRPKEAKLRDVLFIARLDDGGSMECYKIPVSDTTRSYDELLVNLDMCDRFVRKKKSLVAVLDVLTKFEEARFLHPLKSPERVLYIELPRFKLAFRLNSSTRFESVEHKGYILATGQQFDDFLPRFQRYLVLVLKDRFDTSRPEFRMLLPVGAVVEASTGMVDIAIGRNASDAMDVACYDIHRRLKTFETETVCARLEFAAICVRAGTDVPSKRLSMTGSEAAIQVLRACRSSRPFSADEKEALQSIYPLSYREPAVKILVVALLTEADRLAFLFGHTQRIPSAMGGTDAKTEYANMCSSHVQRNPLRSQLRSKEEERILGHVQRSSAVEEAITCNSSSVADDYVRSVENRLQLFLWKDRGNVKGTPVFPLNCNSTNAMGRAMLEELQSSWDSYHSRCEPRLKTEPAALLGTFQTLLREVSSRRVEVERYVWDCVAKATSGVYDRLLSLANFLPLLTVGDIVRCGFDRASLHTLAPKLSEASRELVRKGIYTYMELCVLEDKVERLIWQARHSGEVSNTILIDELMNTRQWQSAQYPYWLSFEVEGRLQIRHEQFVIARHLIDGPGTVCQLNMGRGKTRVILPMLFLFYAQNRSSRVVRANFLSPLLSEARQFMHRYLSATSASLGVFEQPFHRTIDLDPRRLEFIRDSLVELKRLGGIQMVAPEHRMSLELKRLALGNDDSTVEMLDEILARDQFVDVLDECDAILHHKYHLVYAVGIPNPLGNGVERWMATEAVLRVVANQAANSRARKVLKAAHVSCSAPDYVTRLGSYDGTRLNALVNSTKLLRDELREAVVLDLIDEAPFELMWLSALSGNAARPPLVTAITDPSVSVQEALGEGLAEITPYVAQLLAMRGLLAFGVLEHCLEKRYRVDFGLPHPGTRQKKIAIPFRAADVPSERSEFSHPDVCIVLTLLGYYHAGLTKEEVRCTFQKLLRLDISEQEHQYDRWFVSVKPGLNGNDREALHDVRHVSLADSRQFETLCRVYQYCMEAINFYLNTCVFPNDTQQYPQRLSRTAWNLAAGGNTIGFSGTNDNHRLLPLSVAQHEPNEPSLRGTNGKMIDKIMQVTHSYEVIVPSPNRGPIPWQSVLLFAMDKNAQCLIDTGALLAGVENSEAAKFLLDQLDFIFAGVTYFDSRKEHNCWMIVEKVRRITLPLKNSSMLEKETFVIFDEARSRGSDMKLLPDASAVITLGPKLTKDKLMQGAGRMRQLGCDQTLWIASFDEVAQTVLQTSGQRLLSRVSTVDVLNWVMDNTKAESVRGLLDWAGSGIHFRTTQINQDKELVDDDWSLETMYQEKLRLDKIAQIIESKAHFDSNISTDTVVEQICCRGFVYGLDDEVCVTSHTDECERELQVEEELIEEREVEVVKCAPAKEKAWQYEKILCARSVEDLNGDVQVVEMTSFIRQRVAPKEMASLAWSSSQIYGTENFFTTIRKSNTRTGVDHVNTFLRMIDVVLVFRNGQVLLLSECEADHILGLLWLTRGTRTKRSFHFMNLAFACESLARGETHTKFSDVYLALGFQVGQELPLLSTMACHLGYQVGQELPLLSTMACHLYNGETMIAKEQQAKAEQAFRDLLRPLVQREVTLSNFVKSRGNSHKWVHSFLHELCRRMDLECCTYKRAMCDDPSESKRQKS